MEIKRLMIEQHDLIFFPDGYPYLILGCCNRQKIFYHKGPMKLYFGSYVYAFIPSIQIPNKGVSRRSQTGGGWRVINFGALKQS